MKIIAPSIHEIRLGIYEHLPSGRLYQALNTLDLLPGQPAWLTVASSLPALDATNNTPDTHRRLTVATDTTGDRSAWPARVTCPRCPWGMDESPDGTALGLKPTMPGTDYPNDHVRHLDRVIQAHLCEHNIQTAEEARSLIDAAVGLSAVEYIGLSLDGSPRPGPRLRVREETEFLLRFLWVDEELTDAMIEREAERIAKAAGNG